MHGTPADVQNSMNKRIKGEKKVLLMSKKTYAIKSCVNSINNRLKSLDGGLCPIFAYT